MNASVRIGRIAGIEVGLHWSLAVVFAFIVWTLAGQVLPSVVPDQSVSAYWVVSGVAGLLFYMSLLSHEMGHALVARRLGVNVDGITLWVFGGVARLKGDAATPGIEAKIVVAGPIVSLALAILFGAATFALDPNVNTSQSIAQFLQAQVSTLTKLLVTHLQTALRFPDDIFEKVFKRNFHK